MKYLATLLLGLLVVQTICSLSMETRRKRAVNNKDSTKRIKKAPREVSSGYKTRVDSQAFFSLVPQRMVRRHSVRFISIILSKIQWQNCNTNYDPRYCRQECTNGRSIGNCPKCSDNEQSEECAEIKREETCLKKFTYQTKETATDAACCKYTMTTSVCGRQLNQYQVDECCKDKLYSTNPLCSCSYVIYHQDWFLPQRVTDCCSAYEIKNNKAHPLCKTHCSPLSKDCCHYVFQFPRNNIPLYNKCCKEFPEDPACDCNTITSSKSIGLYTQEQVKDCCDFFSPGRIPDVCPEYVCPVIQVEKSECCNYYFSRKGVSTTWIQNCCKDKKYSSLDICGDCDCRNNVDCCDREPYKASDFCRCYRTVNGKPFTPENKECFCMIYPNDKMCTCGSSCCKEFFVAGDYTDKLTYSSCCHHPSVDQTLKDKYCVCNDNTIVSDLPDSRKYECCINKAFVHIPKTQPPCCDYVRNNLDGQFSDESIKKVCCAESCTGGCKAGGYCPDECKENTVISAKCCETYNKQPYTFMNQYTECCRLNKLDCKCDYIYSHIQQYGLNHPVVRECCEKPHPTPDVTICQNYCNQETPEDEPRCCNLIVGRQLQSYKSFKDCCKVSLYSNTAICKTSDCETYPGFKDSCCTTYIKDYVNKYSQYQMCCDAQLHPSNGEKVTVDPKCSCDFILANREFFLKNDPSRLAECEKEECTKKYGKEVCDCHTKFKSSSSDFPPAATILECCPLVHNAICSDCVKLLSYLPGMVNFPGVKACCNQPQYFNDPRCRAYSCSDLPLNYGCCSNYFLNENDYETQFKTGQGLTHFTLFKSHCCLNYHVPAGFSKCPPPDCETYPTSLACCNTYDGNSPHRAACCQMSKTTFTDHKKICLCTDNRRKNDPECCKYGLEKEKCCTGNVLSLEYSEANRDSCCSVRFNAQFCCYASNWESLSLGQKQKCCEHSYVPGKCCSVKYQPRECCANHFNDECCKGDLFITGNTYRLKCCSEYRAKINEKASNIWCPECIHKKCTSPYPPICLTCEGKTEEEKRVQNCQCPVPPEPKPGCEGQQCCFHKHPNDQEALNRCLCGFPNYYSSQFCSCVLTPTLPQCDCLLPNPHSSCCGEGKSNICKCAEVFRKYGSVPREKKAISLEDNSLWTTCCNEFFPKGFCIHEPIPLTCKDILPKKIVDDKYKDCCSGIFINSKGNDQIIESDDYKSCCTSLFPKYMAYAPYCQKIKSCSMEIIKDKRNKDKPECCSIIPYRSMPECNVCNQNCVYTPVNGVYHPKFTACCQNYPQKPECCQDYEKPGHPLKEACCARDPKCCANGQWKDITNPHHTLCCGKNLEECCSFTVQQDSSHPDHDFCCQRIECKPNPFTCSNKDYLPHAPLQCQCCKINYDPSRCCECSDCYKVYKAMEEDISKFDVTNKDYIKCCLQQVSPNKICKTIIDECVEVLIDYDKYAGTAKWKECCERRPELCPKPEMCYEKVKICSDVTHKYYNNCCTPIVEPCLPRDVVFKNPLHPYWDYCCRKYDHPKPYCDHKPNPPCLDEPCDEKEAIATSEEHFSTSGVLLTKSRMRKKRFFRNHHSQRDTHDL